MRYIPYLPHTCSSHMQCLLILHLNSCLRKPIFIGTERMYQYALQPASASSMFSWPASFPSHPQALSQPQDVLRLTVSTTWLLFMSFMSLALCPVYKLTLTHLMWLFISDLLSKPKTWMLWWMLADDKISKGCSQVWAWIKHLHLLSLVHGTAYDLLD